jgi:hypothetical protein
MGIIVTTMAKMTNSGVILCFSAPDNIKNNGICDSNDDGSDNKSSHKEVDHGITTYASALIFNSKTVSDSLVA